MIDLPNRPLNSDRVLAAFGVCPRLRFRVIDGLPA